MIRRIDVITALILLGASHLVYGQDLKKSENTQKILTNKPKNINNNKCVLQNKSAKQDINIETKNAEHNDIKAIAVNTVDTPRKGYFPSWLPKALFTIGAGYIAFNTVRSGLQGAFDFLPLVTDTYKSRLSTLNPSMSLQDINREISNLHSYLQPYIACFVQTSLLIATPVVGSWIAYDMKSAASRFKSLGKKLGGDQGGYVGSFVGAGLGGAAHLAFPWVLISTLSIRVIGAFLKSFYSGYPALWHSLSDDTEVTPEPVQKSQESGKIFVPNAEKVFKKATSCKKPLQKPINSNEEGKSTKQITKSAKKTDNG